jgi:hypothetical protein
MDVLVLIDTLDDLVHNAKAIPLTDQVRVDKEGIYEHPRPDTRHDSRGDQAGALDRQGATGDADGGQAARPSGSSRRHASARRG